MRDQLTIVNSFVHDVATGTWISSLALAALLDRHLQRPEWASAAALGGALQRELMWVTWGSLIVIVLTGLVRAATWKAFGWTGDIERSRKRLLAVKHAVLGVVFAAGTAYQALVLVRGRA